MADTIFWRWTPFADLAPADLYALLSARAEVFVVEQDCAFLDTDGLDACAWHLLGRPARADALDATAPVAAYLRLIEPGSKYAEPSIGRVLTTASFRGSGLGKSLMAEGLRQAAVLYPGLALRIGAQRYLERFYANFGFRVASEPYMEDGIAHIEMLRPAARAP
jgi:ElaA protein